MALNLCHCKNLILLDLLDEMMHFNFTDFEMEELCFCSKENTAATTTTQTTTRFEDESRSYEAHSGAKHRKSGTFEKQD